MLDYIAIARGAGVPEEENVWYLFVLSPRRASYHRVTCEPGDSYFREHREHCAGLYSDERSFDDIVEIATALM
jgi:hypothetical protein